MNKDLKNYTASFPGYGIKFFFLQRYHRMAKNNPDKTQETSYRRLFGLIDMNYKKESWLFGVYNLNVFT